MTSGDKNPSLFHYFNILSIDVAAGAVISCAFFAKILGVTILYYGYGILGLTVWIIYTCDHLLDVRRNVHPAATARHRFHQQNFKILVVIVIISLLMVALQVIFIRRPVFIGGLVLSFVVGIYFVLQKKLSFLKEFFAAALYASGVCIAPFSVLQRDLSGPETGLIISFFFTALINLFLFSWYGLKTDALDHHPSFTIVFGERTTRGCLVVLFVVNAIILTVEMANGQAMASLVLATMNVILLLIYLRKNYFEIDDRYRIVGDAVFLIPVLFLLFP